MPYISLMCFFCIPKIELLGQLVFDPLAAKARVLHVQFAFRTLVFGCYFSYVWVHLYHLYATRKLHQWCSKRANLPFPVFGHVHLRISSQSSLLSCKETGSKVCCLLNQII